jgi:general secretion pathway protein L
MPDRLLLRLHPAGDPTWLLQGADGRTSPTATGWPKATVTAQASEIVVLVPAEDVLLTTARVTAKSRAQLMQAVPYAIEDQLLAPVEDLQFAANQDGGDALGVAVVAKGTLRKWLEQLAAAGIRADVLLPESLAVPLRPDRVTLVVETDRVIARLASWSAFACTPGELASWLERATGAEARPVDAFDFRDKAAAALPIPAATHTRRQSDALTFLASGLRKPPLNLLSGEFAPQHRAARGARWWRIAAGLAAAAIVLAVLNLGFEVVQLARASASMDAEAEKRVHQAFPDVEGAEFSRMSPADIARTRIERLRGGAQSSGFLRVVSAIAPVLGSTTRIQTRGMEFRNGVLELGLRAPDVATLDTVRERLAAVPGLKVDVTAANPGENGIDGMIRVGSAPAGGTK